MGNMVSDGAIRIDFVQSQLAQKFPGQVAPYQGRFGCDMKSHYRGTLFRLPLRQVPSGAAAQTSGVFFEPWDVLMAKRMFEQWAEDAKISLLFLDKIKRVEVLASVRDRIQVEKDSDLYKEDGGIVPDFRKVRIRSFGVYDQLLTTSTWLVGTNLNFPENASWIRDTAANNRWIPHRGIALPLDLPREEAGLAKGRVFSYLPTSIVTDQPFHIHGVFALLSSRKGLVASPADNNDGARWNDYMLKELLPPLMVKAMACLLRYKFDRLDSPQYKGSFHDLAESYFRFWPLKSHGDVLPMVLRFWELAHANPIFPILVHQKSENGRSVEGVNGGGVCFPIKFVKPPPSSAMRKMEQLLRENGVRYLDCNPSVISSALFHWGKSSLAITQVDAGLIRVVLRGNDDFMAKIPTEDGRQWMLELLLGDLVDKDQEVIDLQGLPLLPLQDGTWANISPNCTHYTANSTARLLIRTHKELVKESIFRSSAGRLPKVLKALEKDPRYSVTALPPAKFTEYVCAENSEGIPVERLSRFWEYIKGCTASEWVGFGDLPILKTIWGTLVPLKCCQGALKVKEGERIEGSSMVIKLGSALQSAGVVVFRWEENDKHKLLEKNQDCTNANVIAAFMKKGGSLSGMEFKSAEAGTLRDVITNGGHELAKSTFAELGHLRIWPSFGVSQDLICAHGNLMIDGQYDIRNLGDSPDVLNFHPGRHITAFRNMGVRTVYLTQFTRDRIIPRLQSQSFNPNYNAATMLAYTTLMENLVKIAKGNTLQNADAKILLQTGKLILTRDGTIKSSGELYDPMDGLLTLIHAQKSRGRFPNNNVWSILQPERNAVTKVRQSSQDLVLVECAEAVLEEVKARPNAVQTRAMAVALVSRVYNKPSSANWMLAKWAFVPVSTSVFEQYGPLAPMIPSYMCFSDLVLSEYKAIAWTQCGFFPEDLQPPPNARKIWRTVGEPRIRSIVDHLHSLIRDIVPKWTSDNDQLNLQVMLYSTYEALNKFAMKSPTQLNELTDLLKTVTVPYLFNSFDKYMTDRSAWFFPIQLILDVENSTASHELVHPRLAQHRAFLTAAGVREMTKVDFKVSVAPAPNQGDFMNLLSNFFESQDYLNGFMDVCFRFETGQSIYAHKIVLAHWSGHFKDRFQGPWGENGGRDPDHPSVEVIDLSQLENDDPDFYSGFWGIVYYLYKHKLTPWNGPPMSSGSGVGAATASQQEDFLANRVQYLLSLLALADEYLILRLKELIAAELVEGQMIIHGNVFDVREHAELRSCKPIVEYCDKYIRTKDNAETLKSFVLGEIAELQKELRVQSKSGLDIATMKYELEGHRRHLEVIAKITAK